jgi:hypothetical protein
MLYGFVGSAALLAVSNSASSLRLFCAGCFAYILGTAMLYHLGIRRFISGALAFVIALASAETIRAAIRPVELLNGPFGPLAFTKHVDFEKYSWLTRFAKNGDLLFGNPGFNFVLNLENPAKVQWVESDAYTRPEQVKDLVLEMIRKRPRFIIGNSDYQSPGSGDNLGPYRDFLKKHYRVASQFVDRTEIMVDGGQDQNLIGP